MPQSSQVHNLLGCQSGKLLTIINYLQLYYGQWRQRRKIRLTSRYSPIVTWHYLQCATCTYKCVLLIKSIISGIDPGNCGTHGHLVACEDTQQITSQIHWLAALASCTGQQHWLLINTAWVPQLVCVHPESNWIFLTYIGLSQDGQQ